MSSAPGAATLRILLVEDHADIAQMMVTMLRALGHDAADAPTIAAAVDLARSQTFDLLISDYSLPDGNGVEAFKQLRATGLAKAILLTAYGDQFADIARAAGFAKYLEKPVELDALDGAIAQVA